MFLRKYGTLTVTGTTAIRIPIIKRGVVDFAVSADWTPASGDVKIAIDGAAAANVTNLPTAVTMGNTAYWEFILTAAELTCKSCVVTVADSATKAVEDQCFIVETFGNASAMYQSDLSASEIPANVTQISGDSTAADNAEAFFDGTGYAGSGLASQTSVDTLATYVDTEVAAIKAKTDNLPTDPADQSAVEAAITAATSGLASQTSVDTLASYVDTEVAAIKAKTDNLPADPADQSAVEAAITAATGILASQSSVDTLTTYVDTEVAAIKAKTDNLPSDPADASDISASFSSLASSIATLATYVDTEVAAIKAKTDNLPTDPADQSAVEAAITAAVSALATAASLATVATELAKVPKSGETRRYTQIAANAGSKTADVSIGVPL